MVARYRLGPRRRLIVPRAFPGPRASTRRDVARFRTFLLDFRGQFADLLRRMLRLGTLALALIFVSGASKLAFAEPDSEESGDEGGAVSGEPPVAAASHREAAQFRKRKAAPPLQGGGTRGPRLAAPHHAAASAVGPGRAVRAGVARAGHPGHLQRRRFVRRRRAAQGGSHAPLQAHRHGKSDRARACWRSSRTSTITSESGSRSFPDIGTSASRPATTSRVRPPTSASQGVPPKKMRSAFASTLDPGGMGIGIYPRSKFVHIDVRPPPSYRWIDNARPQPELARQAAPPRLEAQEAPELGLGLAASPANAPRTVREERQDPSSGGPPFLQFRWGSFSLRAGAVALRPAVFAILAARRSRRFKNPRSNLRTTIWRSSDNWISTSPTKAQKRSAESPGRGQTEEPPQGTQGAGGKGGGGGQGGDGDGGGDGPGGPPDATPRSPTRRSAAI